MRRLLGHTPETGPWKGVAEHLGGLGRQPRSSGVAAMATRNAAGQWDLRGRQPPLGRNVQRARSVWRGEVEGEEKFREYKS